jgi:hypothetical protein
MIEAIALMLAIITAAVPFSNNYFKAKITAKCLIYSALKLISLII